MTPAVTLRRWNRRDIGLVEALRATFAALGDGATLVAMCSSPREWRFVRLKAGAGAPEFDSGGLPDLVVADIFDLRAFVLGGSGPFEFRWRADGTGSLSAWLTTRAGFDPARLGAEALAPIAVAEEIGSQRLLFGRAVPGVAPPGWVALREGRIGEIRVPCDGSGPCVTIGGVELVAKEATYGNAYVAEELLVEIVAIQTGKDE